MFKHLVWASKSETELGKCPQLLIAVIPDDDCCCHHCLIDQSSDELRVLDAIDYVEDVVGHGEQDGE